MASWNLRTHDSDWSADFTTESADTGLLFFLEADDDDEEVPTLEEVRAKIEEILGYTDTDVGANGKVQRVLPMAHPIYPGLTAYRVRVQPVPGEPDFEVEAADPEEILEAQPIHPDAVAWGSWQFDVRFAPKPYQMVATGTMPTITGSYKDAANATQSYTHYNEHFRYCTYEFAPRDEIAKARHGNLKFRRQAGTAPDGAPYADFPRLPLPDEVLTIRWHMVPQRFVTSAFSYLRAFKYHINQKPFTVGDSEYAPGSILYVGYKTRQFSSPFAVLDDSWGGAGVTASAKLVDIDITLYITNRTAVDPPDLTGLNGNWLAEGWNTFPNLNYGAAGSGGGFFYVSADNGDGDKQYPFFNSFPVEMLFTDPDAA